MKKWIIYKATSPCGRAYVGATCATLNQRKRCHKYYAKGEYKTLIGKAITKYGIDNIKWEVLEENISSENIAMNREIFWIKKLKTHENGLNLTIGGKSGWQKDDRIRNKISATVKKYHKKEGTKIKHSRERGGTPILVFKAVQIQRQSNSGKKAIFVKGDFIGQYETQIDACHSLGVDKSKVNSCLNGYRKTHKGYLFERILDASQ